MIQRNYSPKVKFVAKGSTAALNCALADHLTKWFGSGLKMVELQLKKSKLDRDNGDLDAIESTGTIVDRNELLKNLIKK